MLPLAPRAWLYPALGLVRRFVLPRLHLGFYVVPTEPRLTFAYYDGSGWKFATIKDSGVTSDTLPAVGLWKDQSCTNSWNGPGYAADRAYVSMTNSGVVWDIAPPTTPFALPFHQEYR
jgi:hypothetical protein